jgi:XisI protein
MISHQRAVLELIERWAKVDSTEQSDATIKIIDELGGRYLLFNNTWKDGRRYYGCFLHLDLSADGKVWIQHDGTDLNVAEQLMEAGIAKEEIVLGFQLPSVRAVLGFGAG